MPDESLRFVLTVGGIERSRHKTLDAAKKRARGKSPSHLVNIQGLYPKKGEAVLWVLAPGGVWLAYD